MTDEKTVTLTLNMELSDRETFLIGKIMAQWGWLEHQIFLQTLLTFEGVADDTPELPKAMNNIRFTGVLDLWKERVVDRASEEHAATLREQLEEIRRLKPGRDALVHGMWQWSPSNLSQISTVRVRNRKIIEILFTADDLEDFYRRVAGVNFTIRYPGGIDDLARKRAEEGMYVSRRFLAAITGDQVANDWQSALLNADDFEDGKSDA